LKETKGYYLPNRKIMLFLYRISTPMSIFTVLLIAFMAFYLSSVMKKLLLMDVLLILCFVFLFLFLSALTSFSVSLKKNAISITLRNLNVEVPYSFIDGVKLIEDKFYSSELLELSLKSNIVMSKYFLFLGLLAGFRKKTKESKQVIVFNVENSRELYEELKRIVKENNE
jgi:hypothetical protein